MLAGTRCSRRSRANARANPHLLNFTADDQSSSGRGGLTEDELISQRLASSELIPQAVTRNHRRAAAIAGPRRVPDSSSGSATFSSAVSPRDLPGGSLR